MISKPPYINHGKDIQREAKVFKSGKRLSVSTVTTGTTTKQNGDLSLVEERS